MMALKSHMVEFQAEGRPGRGYLATPEKPRGGVLVLHAWWGLNDFFGGIFLGFLVAAGFYAGIIYFKIWLVPIALGLFGLGLLLVLRRAGA